MRRRPALFLLAAAVAACGGSDDATVASGATPAPAPPPTWTVGPITLAVGAPFDLARTLPAGVPAGGVFGVSTAGTQLPAGVTLSPAGLLSMGTAVPGTVNGVLFSYTY